MGANLFQIGLAGAVLEISRTIFELPTGLFADRHGRRLSLVLSAVTHAAAVAILLVGNNLHVIYVSSFIYGLGDSFQSGALEAWLMDHLKAQKRSNAFKAKVTDAYIALYSSCVAASLVASSLFAVHPHRVTLASMVLFVVAFLCALAIPEEMGRTAETSPLVEKRMPYTVLQGIKEVYRIISSSPRLRIFFGAGFFLSLGVDGIERYYQPFLKEAGFGYTKIALIYTISSGFGLLMLFADRLLGRLVKVGDLGPLTVFCGVLATLLGLMLSLGGDGPYIALIAFFGFRYLLRPAEQTYLNRAIPSSLRATTLSAYELVGAVGEVFAGLVIGFAASAAGLQPAIGLAAFSIFVSTLGFFSVRIITKRNHVSR